MNSVVMRQWWTYIKAQFLIEVYLFVYFFIGIVGMACYRTWNDTSVFSYPYITCMYIRLDDVVRVSQATITWQTYIRQVIDLSDVEHLHSGCGHTNCTNHHTCTLVYSHIKQPADKHLILDTITSRQSSMISFHGSRFPFALDVGSFPLLLDWQ